ncbi:MAG: hypothetical protein AAGA12_06385 [Pseudomonadota bacterium]
MIKRLGRKFSTALLLLLGACGMVARCSEPDPLDIAAIDALYERPAEPVGGPLRVFHLGHSLVGRDMPAMLQQLAPDGHRYESQLGWGSVLKSHWDPKVEINGFEVENAHPRYRDAHEAIESAEYDALVVTEAVEIRDSIKFHDSGKMLHNWAEKAHSQDPSARVYFYETWHELDDPEGWLERLDTDLSKYWEGEILHKALAYETDAKPIYVIPGGQVMARFVRAVEASGGIGQIKSRTDLFKDKIHFNDLGAYLMALTHYAVLYQSSPIGLPHSLLKADGSAAVDPGPEAADLMQRIVWQTVTGYAKTGVQDDP